MERKTAERQSSEQMVQLVCFKLADEQYGLDITQVQEVIRMQKITPVPRMPEFVLGVVNIRGTVVPVFDLRKKFSLSMKPFDDKTKIMVVVNNGVQTSFIVDEILDNVKFEESRKNPPPSVKMKIKKECLKGLAMLENRTVIIIDLDNLSDDINKSIN